MTNAFSVVDCRTNKVVFQCNSSKQAWDEADRRDNRFGAVRFRVERDFDVMSVEEFDAMMQQERAA